MIHRKSIPLWIKMYSGFLILTALVGTYAGYVDPYVFFSGFTQYNVDMQAMPMTFLNGLWGSRNLGAMTVLVVGLVSGRSQILMAVFLHRFLVELQDIFILGTFYNPDGTPIWGYIVGIALFLVPEGLGAATLWRLTARPKATFAPS